MTKHLQILAIAMAFGASGGQASIPTENKTWSSGHTHLVLGTLDSRPQETSSTISEPWYTDATLRLDYILAGTNETQAVFLNRLKTFEGWYGKRCHMDSLHLQGNGNITVTNLAGTDTLYRHSFSTLFQEWQSTEEATQVARSFENSFLIPMPREKVQVTVELRNIHNNTKSYLKHIVDPQDRLIAKHNSKETLPYRYLHKAGDSKEKIDVVFIPEGYTTKEMKQFRKDCMESMESIFRHKPFSQLKDRFNFIITEVPSEHSGVSIPKHGEWKNTAVGSNFDTFYSERYLTTSNISRLYDILDGVPCESIIILANTDEYGGGGIYNNYMLSAARGRDYKSVIVHEFGHSFAGLGDEYFYDDQYETYYPAGIEPWEQNLTNLTNFESKWKDMLPPGTEIPTKADSKDIHTKLGVYEGGGYQSKGVYRPVQDCRMHTNKAPDFCPVCQRAILRLVNYLSNED